MSVMFLVLLVGAVLLFQALRKIGHLEQRIRVIEGKIVSVGQRDFANVDRETESNLDDENISDAPPVAQAAQDSARTDTRAEASPAQAATSAAPIDASEQQREPAMAYRRPARVISTKAEPTAEQIGEITNDAANDTIGPPEFTEIEGSAMADDSGRIPFRGLSFNFEDLFGRRLPIWGGGITLAIAGVLIVKYALDAGLFQRVFTPWVQVLSGFLFGTGLLAGAELAHRKAAQVNDPRISQALSGAGIATLYSAFLIAANGYGLIGPMAAFLGLAAVTAGALGLSTRFGAPSALLGLAGGLAAPAMISAISANVPILAIYLALTIAGLTGVSRMQRWPWLGLAALVGGAGWSMWMVLATSALDTLASLSVGGFILLLAVVLPMLTISGARAAFMRTGAVMIGAAQLAILVAMGGFQPLHWGMFALLAAAGQWLSYRDRSFDIIPTISLGLSVFLLAIWPEPAANWIAASALALAAIHALPLQIRIWQTPPRLQLALELCGLATAAPLLTLWHYYINDESRDAIFAVVAAMAAMLPAAAMLTGWRRKDRLGDSRFSWLAATGGALFMVSLSFALPVWQVPLGFAAIAAAMLFLGEKSGDSRLEQNAAGIALVAGLALVVTMKANWLELHRLFIGETGAVNLYSVLRWSGLAALFALFSARAKSVHILVAAYALVAAFAYGALAQMLPGWMLPIALCAVAAIMLLIGQRRNDIVIEAQAATFTILAIPLLIVTQSVGSVEWQRLVWMNDYDVDGLAVLRWLTLSGAALLFAFLCRIAAVRNGAQALAAAFSYGAVAQFIPSTFVPLAAPAALAGLAYWSKRLTWPRLQTASAVFVAILLGWAASPLSVWGVKAVFSLVGIPMSVDGNLLSVITITTRLLYPAAMLALAVGLARQQLPDNVRTSYRMLIAILAGIAAHSLYRLNFAAVFGSDFISTGLSQRLLWSAILIGGGWIMWRKSIGILRDRFAPALVSAGIVHLLWYSLIIHNPLWTAQAVGSLPIFNLLIPTFGILVTALHLLRKMVPEKVATLAARPLQLMYMMMICLFCWASLRQIFHGSILIESGVSATEDILRSILGIMLAIGFLLWGIRVQQRDWRIISLVVLLAATTKVFLFDTSGLQGLMRIGSFVALGFSLIGIGWLYSRQLGRDAKADV